ncbi:MAG: site-2 protease family protein [Saprospiraceae bacterium]|nr:site-2 protease family protein [Saprospiraceae bacterium]
MHTSIQIAKIWGIPVRLHWTFVLVLGWLVYLGIPDWQYFRGQRALWMFISVFAVFTCILLHELGHAFMARRYGVQTLQIMLSPIGGQAILERMPKQPKKELLVALAGPIVNVVLALCALPFLYWIPAEKLAHLPHFFSNPNGNTFLRLDMDERFIIGFVLLNFLVALFNLIPAFPLDGGRILRALLSMRMNKLGATRIATFLGQGFAALIVLFSVSQYNWLMGVIGLFIFISASMEYRYVKLDSRLHSFSVHDILRPRFTRIYLDQNLSEVIQQWREGSEKNFLVFDRADQLKGVLTSPVLMEHQLSDQEELVDSLITQEYESVAREDNLMKVIRLMQDEDYEILPVYEGGELLGVVDWNDVEHFVRLQKEQVR